MPVDLLCARYVTGVVEENVLVAFDDSDVRIFEMLGEPFRAHQNLGMHVTLAGDRRIDRGGIGSDCRCHIQFRKKRATCIIRLISRSCKGVRGVSVSLVDDGEKSAANGAVLAARARMYG